MTAPSPPIVLATDGSVHSLAAFAPTVELARMLGARILLVTVVVDGPPPPGDGFRPMPRVQRQWTEAEIQACRQRLEALAAARLAGVPVDCEVLRGESADAVLANLAAVRNAQFIAMARRGARPGDATGDAQLGSVADGVVRRATRPVIIFPVAA